MADTEAPAISRQQIENLKFNWRNDPCWDIEDTEGFESVRNELLAYRLEIEAEWQVRLDRRIESVAIAYDIKSNLKLAAIIMHLEDRIRDFERRVSALESAQ